MTKVNSLMKEYSCKLFILCVGMTLIACQQDSRLFTHINPKQSGLEFRNALEETQDNNIMTYEYSYNGGGVAVGDVNGDDLADVYFSGNTVSNKIGRAHV